MSEELAVEQRQQHKEPHGTGQEPARAHPPAPGTPAAAVLRLQRQAGNRAVQRLLAQRKGGGGIELDDATAGRINKARSGGQPLDSAVQQEMGARLGYDFRNVSVHSDGESEELNEQLNARAFTTGHDVFFRQGTYDPGSSSGQELLAHELSHVVQQGTGRVGGGARMAVRPAGDAFEQEADAAASRAASSAHEAAGPAAPAGIQRQGAPEEEEVQTKPLQRQGGAEEEEVQTLALQRQGGPEEEEAQAQALQRQGAGEEEEQA